MLNKKKELDMDRLDMLMDKYDSPEGLVNLIVDHDRLTAKEFWQVFRYVYEDLDNVHFLTELSAARRVIDNKYNLASASMEKDEQKELFRMQHESTKCTIYRGTLGKYNIGYSWTLNKGRATWFATRFARVYNKTPMLHEVQVPTKTIKAYWGLREQEIFIPPSILLKNKQDILLTKCG